jgi:TRAP-type uncharacterized transport system substrate-binding protein
MGSRSSAVRARETIYTLGPALLGVVLVALAFWGASRFVEPAPPMHLTIATASKGSPYYRIAERWQKHLARNGVRLELRETAGSLQNLELVRREGSGVMAAIVQGGISSATDAPELVSLGRIAYEPVWVFYRGEERLDRLSQLAGKRVLIGPAGGGTSFLATRLLAASGVTDKTSTLVNMDLPDYVDALATGKADAGLLVLAPDARTIERLFAVPDIRLMSLSQADALAQRFPYLSRIDLKHGIVDFSRNIPSADTAMVATLAAVVIHENLHPALANLLTQAIVAERAQPLVGPNGEAPILQRMADQLGVDPEYPLSDEARRVYRAGTPFLQRYLPFWLATLADRLAVMLVPIIGVLLPMLRLGPKLYTWQVRRRLLHWYQELKLVEDDLDARPDDATIAAKLGRVDEIEQAVNEIPLPLTFTNQLYDLRQHIELVRHRLTSRRALAKSNGDAA